MSASEWLMSADEDEIHEVIKNYGEERFSRQIARAIVAQRADSPIDTTGKLAQMRRKTSVLASAAKTRRRGRFKPFGFSSTVSLKK